MDIRSIMIVSLGNSSWNCEIKGIYWTGTWTKWLPITLKETKLLFLKGFCLKAFCIYGIYVYALSTISSHNFIHECMFDLLQSPVTFIFHILLINKRGAQDLRRRPSCFLNALYFQKQRNRLGLAIWYKSRVNWFHLWSLISNIWMIVPNLRNSLGTRDQQEGKRWQH